MQTTDRDFCKMFLYTYIIADFVEKSRRGEEPSLGGGGVLFVKFFYDVFGISGNPSVSATHCQLPFQGSLNKSLP